MPNLIYENLDNIRLKNLSKIKNTSYIAKRQIIIKNLRLINKKFKFMQKTLFLAIHYMDHIMLNFETEVKPELIGLCSLIIAGNYYVKIR